MDLTNPSQQMQQPVGPSHEPIPTGDTPDDRLYYETQLGHTLEKTPSDGLKAAIDLALKEIPVSRLSDMWKLNRIENESANSPKISAEQLNQLYPELGVPFTQPTTMAVAEEIARRTREKNELQSIISRGPTNGAVGAAYGLTTFLAQGAVQMIDPINLAAGVAGGAALGAAGIGFRGAGLMAEAGNSFLGNVAGMAVPEAISTAGASMNHEQYDPVQNLATGAAFGTALHLAVPRIFKFMQGKTGEAIRVAEDTSFSRLADDKSPAADVVVEKMAKSMDGANAPETRFGQYHYEPLSNNPADRGYFHASPTHDGDFKDIHKPVIEQDLGQGIYLTDNPGVANGIAANAFGETGGAVSHVKLNGSMNLLNLDNHIPAELHDTLRPLLEESQGKARAEEILTEHSGREVMDEIQGAINLGKLPATAMDEINAHLGDAGYDGYKFKGGHVMGQDNVPHNVVMMFDHGTGDAGGKILPQEMLLADRSKLPEITREEFDSRTRELNDPVKSHVLYDEQSWNEFKSKMESQPESLDAAKLKEGTEQAKQEFDTLKAQGQVSEELDRIVQDETARVKQELADKELATKSGMVCMGGDL